MKPDGGPAFPQLPHPIGSYTTWVGISARDFFAAAALQGILNGLGNDVKAYIKRSEYTAIAYAYADDMLAEREKERE